ncbi:hypothetical protein ACQKNX_02280 [Lysinibacillus sp. NPDC093712]|uniref:hypothetical protein n=1 Tax=Lysinibacillus sp. NPDC093712 TaxID=3390579 RepID=UPI003D06829A
MEYSKSSKVGAVELYETFEGDVNEIAELTKALTVKEIHNKHDFSDLKHVKWIGLKSNKSEVNYDGYSTLNLEIIFNANSRQETDLALCEILEKATAIFQVPCTDGEYHFSTPENNENSLVEQINQWNTEIAKLAKRNIDIGLLKELNSLGPKCLIEVLALNSLTDEKFDEYCQLYREKEKLSLAQIYNIKCSH